MLSASCKYGIRAVVYLASQEEAGEAYTSIRTLSKDLGISFHFLTKVLQVLSRSDLVRSSRGPNGGVALARPVDEISLFDIVKSIDGSALFEQCFLGLPSCGEGNPCPFHTWWAEERERIGGTFRRTTLDQVIPHLGSEKLIEFR